MTPPTGILILRPLAALLFSVIISLTLSCKGVEDGILIAPTIFSPADETIRTEPSLYLREYENEHRTVTKFLCELNDRITHIEADVCINPNDHDNLTVQLKSPKGTSVFLYCLDHSAKTISQFTKSRLGSCYECCLFHVTSEDISRFQGESCAGVWTLYISSDDVFLDSNPVAWRLNINLYN